MIDTFVSVSDRRAPNVHPSAVRQGHGNRWNAAVLGRRPENIDVAVAVAAVISIPMGGSRSLVQQQFVGLATGVVRVVAIRFQQTQESSRGGDRFCETSIAGCPMLREQGRR